jgi:hypothetical protein
MARASELWGRVRGEIKTTADRTRRGAERALRSGVLNVDLISLRRDRNRAHADLGERVLSLWRSGRLGALAEDGEFIRLKTLVETIDESVAAKEEELRQLRAREREPLPGH